MRFGNSHSRSSVLDGFSLIEIIGVMTMVSLVASIVIFAKARPPAASLRIDTEQLAADLRHIQIRALSDLNSWELTFTSSHSYQISRSGSTPARLPGSSTTTRQLNSTASGQSLPSIGFDSRGRPIDSLARLHTGPTAISLTDGHRTTTTTIHPETGFIR